MRVYAKQAANLEWLRAFQQSQGPALSAACNAQTSQASCTAARLICQSPRWGPCNKLLHVSWQAVSFKVGCLRRRVAHAEMHSRLSHALECGD